MRLSLSQFLPELDSLLVFASDYRIDDPEGRNQLKACGLEMLADLRESITWELTDGTGSGEAAEAMESFLNELAPILANVDDGSLSDRRARIFTEDALRPLRERVAELVKGLSETGTGTAVDSAASEPETETGKPPGRRSRHADR